MGKPHLFVYSEHGDTAPPGAAEAPVFYSEFQDFYAAYYRVVVGYLRKKLSRLEDAEDLAGKVFLYCLEKWETYDPAKAKQSTWLFMVVRSRWIDFLRRDRGWVDVDELGEILPGGEDPMDRAATLEALREELAEELAALPEKQRIAVIMRYFGENTDEDIARRLGTTAGNVRVLVHRGLEKLKGSQRLRELLG